ncbi:hypothetical protein [Kitasatospora sp. NPDC057595]|uniref:hypothetical protein n=1 Tax=Kitasatospora sp. NPDC057595 TaxID=3346177 RepID=UPI0036C52B13
MTEPSASDFPLDDYRAANAADRAPSVERFPGRPGSAPHQRLTGTVAQTPSELANHAWVTRNSSSDPCPGLVLLALSR